MDFSLHINMDNEFFNANPEVKLSLLLEKIGGRIVSGETEGRILDGNGNFCGTFTINVSE